MGRILEGGTCENCGKAIGSYQFNPNQTQSGGKNYCSSHCRREDRGPLV